MKILITGSSGHLGEALIRTLRAAGDTTVGVDLKPSKFTDVVGSITDAAVVDEAIEGCAAVIHTATLHKPHIATHSRQEFVDANVSGTLNLLEAAVSQRCNAFVFTSTTSVFGDALRTTHGQPAVWVTEQLKPIPKNIYGATKLAAEELCGLFQRQTGLPCLVLRTSRFFLEEDDLSDNRIDFNDANLKLNELLHRRVDIADIVEAHRIALTKAQQIGFDRFIISAPPPFEEVDALEIGRDTKAVLERQVPEFRKLYAAKNWELPARLDRVYDPSYAQSQLDWTPKYTFVRAITQISLGRDHHSELALQVSTKGYHSQTFADGPYPTGSF